MRSEWFSRLMLVGMVALGFLASCSQPTPEAETSTPSVVEPEQIPEAQTRVLPTLYPTSTTFPTPLPTNTHPPQEVPPTSTPIDFEQLVVELRYAIPLIGLDRTMSGDVSGRLNVVDVANDFTVEQRNQAGVLLELQQSLPELELADLPEDCDGCVWLEYELPLTGDQDEGWLQDDRMLVSLENFTTNAVGPHLPPGTIFALRRSSSPYHNAHTVALTGSGQLWRWSAIDEEVAGPELIPANDSLLSLNITQVELEQLESLLAGSCPDRVGFETLYFMSEDTERYIDIVCPELALPPNLLPLYLALDEKSEGLGVEEVHDTYSPAVPQEMLLHYSNEEEQSLTIFYDGRSFAGEDGAIVVSDTITVSTVISMASQLLDSGFVRTGVEVYLSGNAAYAILVRGPAGVGEVFWDDEVLPQLETLVAVLERWLDVRLAAVDSPPESESLESTEESTTATPTATPTPES